MPFYADFQQVRATKDNYKWMDETMSVFQAFLSKVRNICMVVPWSEI